MRFDEFEREDLEKIRKNNFIIFLAIHEIKNILGNNLKFEAYKSEALIYSGSFINYKTRIEKHNRIMKIFKKYKIRYEILNYKSIVHRQVEYLTKTAGE